MEQFRFLKNDTIEFEENSNNMDENMININLNLTRVELNRLLGQRYIKYKPKSCFSDHFFLFTTCESHMNINKSQNKKKISSI